MSNKDTVKRIIIVTILLLYFLADAIYTYKLVWKVFSPTDYAIDLTAEDRNEAGVILSDDKSIVQTFEGSIEGMTGGLVFFKETEIDDTDRIRLIVTDDTESKTLYDAEYYGKDVSGEISFSLDSEARDIVGHEMRLEIITDGVDANNSLILDAVADDAYGDGTCMINEESTSSDLLFAIHAAPFKSDSVRKIFIVIVPILLLLLIAVFLYLNKKNYDLARLFLPVTMVLGVIYMLLLPPFSAPDEVVHFDTAYLLSSKIMGVYEEDNPFKSRVEDSYSEYTYYATADTYAYVFGDIKKTSQETDNTATLHTTSLLEGEPILTKLAAGLGVTVARWINLSYTGLIYMGRFFNLLLTTVFIYAAIRLMPFQKELIFVLGLLPIVLQQRGSFSYDGPVFAMFFFMAAYFLYLIYKKERIEIKDYIWIALMIVFIVPCKMVYFVVSILVLLVPSVKFRNKKTEIGTKLVVVLSAIGSAFITNASRVTSVPGEHADRGYLLSEIFSDLPHMVYLFVGSIHYRMCDYIDTTVGTRLGPIMYSYTTEFAVALCFILVMSFAFTNKNRVTSQAKLLFFVIAMMSIGMSFGTMLLGWTPKDYEWIEGVQGRYFIPVLPLLLLSLPTIQVAEDVEQRIKKYSIFGICYVNAIMIVRLYQLVMFTGA